jgi:hypothetical protein
MVPLAYIPQYKEMSSNLLEQQVKEMIQTLFPFERVKNEKRVISKDKIVKITQSPLSLHKPLFSSVSILVPLFLLHFFSPFFLHSTQLILVSSNNRLFSQKLNIY